MKKIIIALLLTILFSFNTASATICRGPGGCAGTYQLNRTNPGPALILFYNKKCQVCWDIMKQGTNYSKTEVGKRFPLFVLHTLAPMPKWITAAFKNGRIKKEKTFPILIKWDGEKEIGRMIKLPEGAR